MLLPAGSTASFQPNMGCLLPSLKQNSFQPSLEVYTNEDYEKFELIDFRTTRYQKPEGSNEDLEDNLEFDEEDIQVHQDELRPEPKRVRQEDEDPTLEQQHALPLPAPSQDQEMKEERPKPRIKRNCI
mmetsp:Transcript_6772/g.10892  ORF Transcript_6772/g.10892 Transcript_6772/m.10892 type:complete len:128 (-) Transcript_6772:938-1321(-)